MRHAFRLAAGLAAVGALAPSFAVRRAVAAAPDKQVCLAAYEQTQKLRKEGKLLSAKEQALVCAQDGCPAVVRDDCTSWSVEIEKSTPTIVLAVTDAEGRDVTDARVFLDGEEVKAHVSGKAIALDPGKHALRVEREGEEPLEQEVIAREGEKNRTVTARFAAQGASSGAAPSPAPAPALPTTARPVPAATWAFVGLGVAGLAGFAAFGLQGNSKKSDLDARGCKPDCPQADIDSAKTSYLLADVGLGVAIVSFGVAAILYATRGEEPAPTATTSAVPRVDLAVSARGGGASLQWSF